MRSISALLLTAAIALPAGPARGELATSATQGDWPQWRGPDRNGVSPETGLLKEWPKDGPTLLWKVHVIGAGYSSVTLSGGRIYTMGDIDGSSRVVCLDAGGKVLWDTPVGKSGAPGWGGFAGPRGSVTLHDGLAWGVDQWGQLVCVDAQTGKERWRKSYTKDLGASRPEWGFTESPLFDGGRLIVTPGGEQGTLAALDSKTGGVIWRTKEFVDGAQYSSVLPAVIGGIRQYVQLTGMNLVGVSVDGKVLWKAKREGSTAVIPDPVVMDGMVYVTSGYGVGDNLFQVKGGGTHFTVEQVYAGKEMKNHHGGVVRVGGHVYGYSDDGGWICQEIKTGKVVWREKDKLGKGCLTAADGMLYLRTEDGPGTIALIEATPGGWREHGRFDQPERSEKNSWTHPVIAGGKLYIRDQDLLLCYDVKGR